MRSPLSDCRSENSLAGNPFVFDVCSSSPQTPIDEIQLLHVCDSGAHNPNGLDSEQRLATELSSVPNDKSESPKPTKHSESEPRGIGTTQNISALSTSREEMPQLLQTPSRGYERPTLTRSCGSQMSIFETDSETPLTPASAALALLSKRFKKKKKKRSINSTSPLRLQSETVSAKPLLTGDARRLYVIYPPEGVGLLVFEKSPSSCKVLAGSADCLLQEILKPVSLITGI